MGLTPKESEDAKFVFSIYDFDGNGKMDAMNIGDALRALNLTPSLATIENMGGTNRRGLKSYTVEEFLSIYAEAKNVRDVGTIDEFIECFKSNDKEGDGTISTTQLAHFLQSYGEKLETEEADAIIQECGNPFEGLVSYIPFLQNVMAGPGNVGKATDTTTESIPQEQSTTLEPTVLDKEKSPSQPPQEEGTVAKAKTKPKPKPIRAPSVVEDVGGEPTTPTKVQGLKTTKSKTTNPADVEGAKNAAAAAAEAKLKPKKQMPLISMKTMGLIGNMVDKGVKG